MLGVYTIPDHTGSTNFMVSKLMSLNSNAANLPFSRGEVPCSFAGRVRLHYSLPQGLPSTGLGFRA